MKAEGGMFLFILHPSSFILACLPLASNDLLGCVWANPIDFVIIAQPATPESSSRFRIHLIQFSSSVPSRHGQSTLSSEAALPRKALLLAHSWHPLLTDLREIRILHCAASANSLE